MVNACFFELLEGLHFFCGLPRTILTMHTEDSIHEAWGIVSIVPVWKWLENKVFIIWRQ